jgi:hypothetical protein
VIWRHYFLDSTYDPQTITHWHPYRAAVFENGRVVSWETASDRL